MSKAKKNKPKKPRTKSIAPRQQQTPIESKSSEELALLLGEQYKMVMQCQNNIIAINSVLEQRRIQLVNAKKEAVDGKQGN